ncbi:MAG: class I SAM-dependent methyltransferase [Nitrospiraceae bacterium]
MSLPVGSAAAQNHTNRKPVGHGNGALIAEIAREIEQSGPLTFARFMELALYHPQFGYYMRPPSESGVERIGWSGDFYTSSDVHSVLGQALAKQAGQLDDCLGHPTPFTVVEMGAGKGLLARDFLKASSTSDSFFSRLHYVLIERSPAMRALQYENLTPWLRHAGRVSWLENIETLPSNSLEGFFFSNELVDALPVHRVEMAGGDLKEVFVDRRQEQFVECLRPLSTPALSDYLDRLGIELPHGYRTEINLQATEWMRTVARAIKRGLVITIDYGHSASDLFSGDRARGTLLCYYHQMASEDPFTRVGEQDMTAHVDFTTLATVGEEAGLSLTGFTNQMSFLMGLGVEEWLESLDPESQELQTAIQLLRPDGMGRTFKILVQHRGIPRPDLDGLKFKPFFGEALAQARGAGLEAEGTRPATCTGPSAFSPRA